MGCRQELLVSSYCVAVPNSAAEVHRRRMRRRQLTKSRPARKKRRRRPWATAWPWDGGDGPSFSGRGGRYLGKQIFAFQFSIYFVEAATREGQTKFYFADGELRFCGCGSCHSYTYLASFFFCVRGKTRGCCPHPKSLISRGVMVTTENCDEVFVGAGWAGVYSFYRRITNDNNINNNDDNNRGPPEPARSYCLFQQSWRIGGRTYSVRVNHTTPTNTTDLVQDIGAYRYSPDMHLPGDLIDRDLQLTTECYQLGCPSARTDFPPNFLFNCTAPLRRIVDPGTGMPSGYVMPLRRMIDIAKSRGGRVFTSTGLTRLEILHTGAAGSDDGGKNSNTNSRMKLQFRNAMTNATIDVINPSVVVLNLPRNKLFDVDGVEESLDPNVAQTLRCTAFDTPSDLFAHPLEDPPDEVTTLEKAYLYYEDAWWRTKLNLMEGEWPLPASFLTRPTRDGLRFNVRWHDGPVQCSVAAAAADSNLSAEEQRCRGLLEIYYSVSNETFYSSLATDPNEPLGSIWDTESDDDEHDASAAMLTKVHAGLMDILAPLLVTRELAASDFASPRGMIVGVWNRPNLDDPLGRGYTAPTKVLYDPRMSGPPGRACGVAGLTDELYRDIALQPWTSKNLPNLFLVNNDWVCMNVRYFFGDWAEESLLQAERVMHILGTPRPLWLNESYYREKVVAMAPGASSRPGQVDGPIRTIFALAPVALLCTFIVLYRRFSSRQRKQYLPLP